MKTKILGLFFAGLMLAAAPVHAAVLNVTPGTVTTIGAISDSAFDLTAETGLNSGSTVTAFGAGEVTPFGLSSSELAQVTFTFLGKEAGFTNTFAVNADSFTNNAPVGTSFSAALNGFLPFVLSSGGLVETATNNGIIDAGLAYAIAIESATSVIVLFDDGGMGTDFDDLAVRVTVSQVPLPAAAWLLISAILGLVSFSRIRRSGTTTA